MLDNIAIIGGGGAIGRALATRLVEDHPAAKLTVFARETSGLEDGRFKACSIDYSNEESIAAAGGIATQDGPLDRIIIATGILHGEGFMPEKSLRDLSSDNFQTLFEANTIVPAMLAKHFIPKLNKLSPSVFAALSARVGSISDNRLGGWYAYRSSKAALNMIIKTAAIETARRNSNAIIIGLHPGTVDTVLSKPFQRNVPEGKLFTPEYSAAKLLDVINQVESKDSGLLFAWDGKQVPF